MPRDDVPDDGSRRDASPNVLGERLEVVSLSPMTGFLRDGCCDTSRQDIGSHTVCVVMSEGFLEFSRFRGKALELGQAPRVVLRATHAAGALKDCALADLKRLAVDLT